MSRKTMYPSAEGSERWRLGGSSALLEVKYALRSLWRDRLVSLAVILSLGLALAANTALFSVFDGLLYRPLRYRDATSIVHLQIAPHLALPDRRGDRRALLERLASSPLLIERVTASPAQLFDRASAAASEWRLRPHEITPSFFELLGVRPSLGRPFNEEDLDGPRFSVLLGHELWRTRFGADPSVVGTTVDLPGTSSADRWHVIGVMPPDFSFPQGANFWIPRYRSRGTVDVQPYARLASGTSIEQVRALFPGLVVTPLREHLRSGGAVSVGILLGGTALLLLIAWVHVASLLFGRATGRAREIGTRLALGASRWHMMRGFAIEAAMLIVPTFWLAMSLTPLLVSALVAVLPPAITLGQDVATDIRAVAMALALVGIGLVLLVVLPMNLVRRGTPLVLLRGDIVRDVRLKSTRIRYGLLVVQLTAVTAIVYLSCLMSISFSRASTAEFGFANEGLFAVRMPRAESTVSGGQDARARLGRQREIVRETLHQLRSLGTVVAAAGSSTWPLEPSALDDETFYAESDPAKHAVDGAYQSIMPGYPVALGVRLTDGAEPSAAEVEQLTMPPAVQIGLVNRALARHLEQFGPVVGQTVVLGVSRRYRVVGVMPDIVLERLDRPARPMIFGYLPPPAVTNVVLFRLAPGVEPDAAGVVRVLSNIWGPRSPRPMAINTAIELSTTEFRSRAYLLTAVALIALPLALLGVFGALSYVTRQQSHDIAVALAIGATPGDIRRQIIRQSLGAAAMAVVAGLGIGVAGGRIISSVLYEVGAVSPGALLVSGSAILLLVALSAALPARRAGSINPASVLRGA